MITVNSYFEGAILLKLCWNAIKLHSTNEPTNSSEV